VEPISFLSKEVAMAQEPEEQADEVAQVVTILFPTVFGLVFLDIFCLKGQKILITSKVVKNGQTIIISDDHNNSLALLVLLVSLCWESVAQQV
jgi:hypothetical protein